MSRNQTKLIKKGSKLKNSDISLIDKRQLGSRIRTGRTKLGLSLEEFGEKINPPANKSIVSRWESGKSVPNNSRIISLAKLLNTDSKHLLFGSKREFISNVIKHSPNLYKELNSRTINSKNLMDMVINFIINDLKDSSSDFLGNSELVYQSLVAALGYFTRYPINDNDYISLIVDHLKLIKNQAENNQPMLFLKPEKGVQYDISEPKKKEILKTLDTAISSLNNLIN